MIHIMNREQIVENGLTPILRKGRKLALQSIEHAINAVDAKRLVKTKLRLENSNLRVEGCSFDLAKFKNIYVVGGGKAGGKMAQAIEEKLGNYVTAGTMNVPYCTKQETRFIQLNYANHPVPVEAGVRGTQRIMALVEKAQQDDLVICLISGGGSSLMPLPRDGVSLKDKQEITNKLLLSGAAISEINVVRKHLSAFKGGWLAKKAYPAKVLNIVLSDVMGDPLDAIASGPTVPDPSTFCDAKEILEKYNLWLNAPSCVRKTFLKGIKGLIQETPKADDPVFENVFNVIIGDNRTAIEAAFDQLRSEGLKTMFLDDTLEGEARGVGKTIAQLARVLLQDVHVPKPLSVIAGGETTVTVTGKGLGGRNQELALSVALNFQDTEECVVASFSTDGTDGPTDAAGAIVDGYTVRRAKQLGLDAEKYLSANDSYHFFQKLGDLIFTGPTGTNVNDISMIVAL